MKKVSIIIVGAGSRGTGYAEYALEHPDQAKIIGVAEPREKYSNRLVEKHAIQPDLIFNDWQELATKPKLADAVIIATPDAEHVAPAIAFAKKGYHILLEKPMATSEEECRKTTETATDAGIVFAVCHVLRYTAFTRKLKELLTDGLIGEIVSLQTLEPVGYWHQAHSFVRGNWRNEAESSSMLLAKCCHDLDWISHVIDRPCTAVQSFGNLKHFRKSEQPAGAADRCLDCGVESNCAYSALKIYSKFLKKGLTGWPLDVLAADVTEENITEALRTGPYGCCVYACDNDVVDHQVVNMQFEGGATASLTMTAFTEAAARKIRIFGTKGELDCDSTNIKHFDFLTDQWKTIETDPVDPSILGGHGGGDYGLMKAFVNAVAQNDPTLVLSGPSETLASHRMVFAAETARNENRVVQLSSQKDA